MHWLLLLGLAACGTPGSTPSPNDTTTPPSTAGSPAPSTTAPDTTSTSTSTETGGSTATGTGTTSTGTSTGSTTGSDTASTPPTGPSHPDARAVILLIGDGMGRGQLEAGGWYRTGDPRGLTLWTLPHQARINPNGASGITDSAASATAMATGAITFNGAIGVDRDLLAVESLVEVARATGMATGVVTTTTLQHATPAAFTAHHDDRNDEVTIADQQVLTSGADVMLGGGWWYLEPAGGDSRRDDDGLLGALADRGYPYVTTAAELAAADPSVGKLWGAFSGSNLPYVAERSAEVPSLPDMVGKALAVLDTDPDGFLLVVEAGRIDHAGHSNDATRLVAEVQELDETVEALLAWMEGRPDASLVVTADHETGGLDVVSGSGVGEVPEVTWEWGAHSSRHIDAFGVGPGTELLDGLTGSHRDVHALLKSRITGEPFTAPATVPLPNGQLTDLPHEAVRQVNPSSYGVGWNQLDALHVGVDAWGLTVGVAGVFQQDANAVVLLLDTDRTPGSGPAQLMGALDDDRGLLDVVLTNLLFLSPPAVPTFGADYALGSLGGSEVYSLGSPAGLRGLQPLDDLPWLKSAVVFGPGVRPEGEAVAADPEWGLELAVSWSEVYPDLDGAVPPGAEVAIAAVLVNSTGTHSSNQALPPFPEGLDESPGEVPVPLPGVVVIPIDSDGDGRADSGGAPRVE